MPHDHADPAHAGQFHHVELCVSDVETAVDFWDWLLTALGYKPKNEWDGGRSWRAGPAYVVIKQADSPDDSVDRQAPGLNHLAFHAASRAQVDELTQEIRERADATLLYPDQHPYAGDYYALYCEGPDGMKIEVVGPGESANT